MSEFTEHNHNPEKLAEGPHRIIGYLEAFSEEQVLGYVLDANDDSCREFTLIFIHHNDFTSSERPFARTTGQVFYIEQNKKTLDNNSVTETYHIIPNAILSDDVDPYEVLHNFRNI